MGVVSASATLGAVIPLLWINLRRHERRRRRMAWALNEGGWWHERIEAVDAQDPSHCLLPFANPLQAGNDLPGIQRSSEADPSRRVLRGELACMASWLHALCRGEQLLRERGLTHLLILEDDSGASLACPELWPFSLPQLIEDLDQRSASHGMPWGVVQLLATSQKAQRLLLDRWRSSAGTEFACARGLVRSGGTGAVLLHRRALPWLLNSLQRWLWRLGWPLHLLVHPRGVRPVADKWLYGSLPAAAVWVVAYPLFCLDACDSAIHPDHIVAYHLPSRSLTLQTWVDDGRLRLLEAQQQWDAIL